MNKTQDVLLVLLSVGCASTNNKSSPSEVNAVEQYFIVIERSPALVPSWVADFLPGAKSSKANAPTTLLLSPQMSTIGYQVVISPRY